MWELLPIAKGKTILAAGSAEQKINHLKIKAYQ